MNEKKMVGKRSVLFSRPPIIIGAGSVAGEKEGNGAFGKCFDMVEEDPLFGGKTWERTIPLGRIRGRKRRAKCSSWRPGLH